MRRKLLRISLIFLPLMGLMVVFMNNTFLQINRTDSVPYSYFLCQKTDTVRRGQLVAIKGHQTAYYRNLIYTKYVRGLPGDKISVGSENGYPLKTQTKDGKLLTPVKEVFVPKGYIFVIGSNIDSFDSRYGEFGLVRAEHIVGRCVGLFKRKGASA